jgi:hypothetical protein
MEIGGIPKDHPLTGCFAKYQRAQEHFDSLNAKVLARYGNGGHPTFLISRGIDPDNSNVFQWSVESVDDPPLEWATIVGDVVHNLRSSLDHLVYELSFLGTRGSPGSRTSFPCSLTRASWCGGDTQRVKLKGVLERHKRRLYMAQPCYGRRDNAKPASFDLRLRHPLSVLHDLWNDDKHRMLLPVATCMTNVDLIIVSTTDCELATDTPKWNPSAFGKRLEVGIQIASVDIVRTGPSVDIDMRFVTDSQVTLLDGIPLMPRLANAAAAVREIISWFSYEFETPTARKLWGLQRTGRIKPAKTHSRRSLYSIPFEIRVDESTTLEQVLAERYQPPTQLNRLPENPPK